MSLWDWVAAAATGGLGGGMAGVAATAAAQPVTQVKKAVDELNKLKKGPPVPDLPPPPTAGSAQKDISTAQQAERQVRGRAANMLFLGSGGSGGGSLTGSYSISRRTLLGA